MRMLSEFQDLEFARVRKDTKCASLRTSVPQTPDTCRLAIVDDRLELQNSTATVVTAALPDHALIPYSHSRVARRPR